LAEQTQELAMLDTNKIQAIAQSYSPQELFAALVWQRQFNQFDGPEVITDLTNHPDLWKSFVFTKPIYAADQDSLSFNGIVETLLAMANYRPMIETSIIHFIPYPADTLYVLAKNQDVIVSQVMALGRSGKLMWWMFVIVAVKIGGFGSMCRFD
jgi:hypothetical protein